MDRNTVIGFVLIGILLMGMFYINSKSRLAYEGEQKRIADSVARLHPPKDTTISRPVNTIAFDTATLRQEQDTTGFQTIGKDAALSLSNNLFTVYFKSKGGQIGKVVLKNYNKYDRTPVVLNSSDFNNFSYVINAGDNKTLNTANVYFEPEMVPSTTAGDQVIRLSAHDNSGRKITHQYTLHPDNYMIDLDVKLEGADKLFSGNNALLEWKTEASQVEKDHKYELTQTHIAYVEKDKFDFETIGKDDDINLNSSTQWVALKQQFFIAALQAENKFNGAEVKWTAPGDTTGYISRMTVAAKTGISGSNTQIPLKFYFGPSDYNVLKKYGNQMENIVPYGSGIFSFVKYINRYFLLPVFDFLRRHVASMGIVILLLTLLIRLITSPILYKSYLSGAKMKVLKPEVDALKAKHTDPKTNQMDQQAFSMDQMKLWRTAGVSPLGGCLPALLQIPIFMSLYYFFQSNIDLRGKSFLWASDLASYDSIFKLPIDIPFYGDHVSLFTLTAVITSLLISIYSMSQMQDNNNPLMKYMPYIFPVLLLGVFNRLPSALTWYYTISNLITLILQVVIQKYIIDHEKILAQISENRKRVPKKSKWQERLDSMQDSQKKLQDMKQKTSKK